MTLSLKRLADPSTLIVLAYAPAGLGHLRVTRALFEGLPANTNAILLPDTASSIRGVHRLTSIHPIANKIFEHSQYGPIESFITSSYRYVLRQDTHVIKKRLLSLLKEQITVPRTLVIVATHFGIAHQVSAIKRRLEIEGQVNVILAVQVTDDSPQKLWYVPNSDLITTPSDLTSESLARYGRSLQLTRSRILTNPYPVSPRLRQRLDQDQWDHKKRQADPKSNVLIHISVPISGAGVGMPYASKLMTVAHNYEPRIRFHITAKRTLFTLPFLNPWERRDYLTISDSHSDRQIIELYEAIHEEVPMLLEVTKPSEQSFKALLDPRSRGGSLLLFTHPVGRQEYDNINFLKRHGMIPNDREAQQLYDVLNFSHTTRQPLPISRWRGFCLPDDPELAGKWISRALSLRVFHSMLQYSPPTSDEVSDTGVEQFWLKVANHIS